MSTVQKWEKEKIGQKNCSIKVQLNKRQVHFFLYLSLIRKKLQYQEPFTEVLSKRDLKFNKQHDRIHEVHKGLCN